MTHQSPGMGETIPEDVKAWETAKQEAIAAVAPTEVPDPAATRHRVERMEAEAIPEDVRWAALDFARKYADERWTSECADDFARAILAERERCAKIAETRFADNGPAKSAQVAEAAGHHIAAAIRKPTP